MLIVIDMQGAQTESRFRGIGRYTMSFTKAVVQNRGDHEIILALSGLFPETIEPIRAAFYDLLPQENIRVWYAPGPVCESQPDNQSRRETAEILREAFLASLEPDIIHISSLFEGYLDDAVTSIGRFDTHTPISIILYDLIPLLNPKAYLNQNRYYKQYYMQKVEYCRQAALFLSISNFSAKEAIEALKLEEDKVVNISAAIDPQFSQIPIEENIKTELYSKFGINQPFILYTGGSDDRKNLPRLVEAYATLPQELVDTHQLLLSGKMDGNAIQQLKQLAHSCGLAVNKLIFTNYINDEELIQLYNLCKLYVFPSWHEGFGLPALEAMACGAPVIAANTSSLPELIGLPEALFDPFDVRSISKKISQVLQDEEFRTYLYEHGLLRAKEFSWSKTASLAIQAWEKLSHQLDKTQHYLTRSSKEYRLLSTTAKSKISASESELISLSHCLAVNHQAGTERQLLVDVSELSQRDSRTGVQRVVRSYLKGLLQSPPEGFRVEPIYGTWQDGYHYARRFTLNFLNQDNPQSNDDPIRWQRGDIFLGLDMQHHVQLANANFYRRLRCEGVVVKFLIYDLLPIQLPNFFRDSNAKDLHEKWLAMIATMDGAICISKATADAFEDWVHQGKFFQTPGFYLDWVHIGSDIDNSHPSQGLPVDALTVLDNLRQRPTFLCVSTVEPRKQQQQILEALELLWQEGIDVNLVFVGQEGWKIESLAKRIRTHQEIGHRLFWLEGISDEYLEKVYAASTCLIAASLNEGFGLPLIEAARHGIPIIARDIPVFREVAGSYAYYFQGENAQDLAQALHHWLDLYSAHNHPSSSKMPWSTWEESTTKLKATLVLEHYPRRQLLVDISELVQRDANTGIQRVVRNILREWLLNPPQGYQGYRVEPVYATLDQGYHYARNFTQKFCNVYAPELEGKLQDEPIDYAPGDIFLGLDLQPQVQVAQGAFYKVLRQQGISVQFVVYDLLSIIMPQYFPTGSNAGFNQWLEVVAGCDGALCISQSVAEELAVWVQNNKLSSESQRPFKIDWFHLGSDIKHRKTITKEPSSGIASILKSIRSRLTFLMVGTLEPRKGHTQVLEAFERLWQDNVDVNLVLVGKQGWLVEELVMRLEAHPQLNRHLFWLKGINDEDLERVYAASTCLIVASYGEGFGLPLIEAARHKLPILARDIPVFREVAGDHACYFNSTDPDMLKIEILEWIQKLKSDSIPKSEAINFITWQDSASQLLNLLTH